MAVHELIHMAGMGLLTSTLAPALAWLTRGRPLARALTGPAWAVLPAFVVLHGAVTLFMGRGEPAAPIHLLIDSLLLAAAVIFWLPVLGERDRRLDDVGRCVYLFLAAPALDLPAVILVAQGHSAGGIAMVVTMLPIGLIAVALMWRLVNAEEAAACRAESTDLAIAPSPRLDAWAPVRWEPPHADP